MGQLTYCNPLAIQQIGDPFILKVSNGRYYCYPTYAAGNNLGFKAWSSDDLIHWKDEG